MAAPNPNLKFSAVDPVALAAVVVAGFVAWRLYKGAGAVAESVKHVATVKLNPVNEGNFINQGFESVVGSVLDMTGSENDSFGKWLFNTLNPDAGFKP